MAGPSFSLLTHGALSWHEPFLSVVSALPLLVTTFAVLLPRIYFTALNVRGQLLSRRDFRFLHQIWVV